MEVKVQQLDTTRDWQSDVSGTGVKGRGREGGPSR